MNFHEWLGTMALIFAFSGGTITGYAIGTGVQDILTIFLQYPQTFVLFAVSILFSVFALAEYTSTKIEKLANEIVQSKIDKCRRSREMQAQYEKTTRKLEEKEKTRRKTK